MVQVVHHVPGRLRIRILAIKGHPVEAARVQARVESMRGVSAATVNAVTGSVLIHYDVRVTRLDEVAAALRLAPAAGVAALPATMGQKLGQRLAKSLVEALIERSAMALIAAL